MADHDEQLQLDDGADEVRRADETRNAAPRPPTQSQSQSPPFRDPSHWKTGDEPMTAAQRSYLSTLATEAGEPLPDDQAMTKAEAAQRIEELQQKTGRGQGTRNA